MATATPLERRDGENRAAAAAAALARRKWREAQEGITSPVSCGPLVWVKTADRLPEHGAYVLTCVDPSHRFNPPVQLEQFLQPSKLAPTTLESLDTSVYGDFGGDGAVISIRNGRNFTEDDFAGVDGVFRNDTYICVASDEWFPAYWMPLPRTPWEANKP